MNMTSGDSKMKNVGDYKAFSNPFSYGILVKIDGNNYEVWSKTFIMTVKGHRKHHILGEIESKDKKDNSTRG